jgi:hypothetical protein
MKRTEFLKKSALGLAGGLAAGKLSAAAFKLRTRNQ